LETERQRLRAVFDTNIFVAAHLSKNPHSPTMELLRRWRQEEFELLYSDDLLVEVDEKFSAIRLFVLHSLTAHPAPPPASPLPPAWSGNRWNH